MRNSAAMPINATEAAMTWPLQRSGKNAVIGKEYRWRSIVESGSAPPRPRSLYGASVWISITVSKERMRLLEKRFTSEDSSPIRRDNYSQDGKEDPHSGPRGSSRSKENDLLFIDTTHCGNRKTEKC